MLKQTNGKIEFTEKDDGIKKSALYDNHLELTKKSRMADFAGYLMPLWYSSISEEHKAVRETAGLFDCTHMGVLKIAGEDAGNFLNVITTNHIESLNVEQAQYSYILDAAGFVLDDVIIYKLEKNEFMIVVNAANEPKIKAYIQAVLQDEIVLDLERPDFKIFAKPEFLDLRTQTGNRGKVNIALQGPASAEIIAELCDSDTKGKISGLGSFKFTEVKLAGIDCIVSKTGYTGSKTGFEIFVSPDEVGTIWDEILDKEKNYGVLPCGLGARDSLRIEAGLPLYGHEIDGEFNISPIETGYSWAVKFEKDFFTGKKEMEKIKAEYTMKVARIQMPGKKGVRPMRYKDAVLDSENKCVGWVLSNSKIEDKQIAHTFIKKEKTDEGRKLGVYYLARNKIQSKKGKLEKVEKGQKLKPDLEGKVVQRFVRF